MSVLQSIDSPDDLRDLPKTELIPLADEIRKYLGQIIPHTGGHFASSLGVVELSIALHYVFDTPKDLLVWDVGHQSYVHKILTGRRESIKNIRQFKGISGFCKRSESPYDAFDSGHASTAISAALGLAVARDLKGENHKIVAVIGDGSLTGGLAYEGMNNAGQSGRNLLVILNDNNMSISRSVGAMANYLNAIITNPFYEKIKAEVWDFTGKITPLTEKLRSLARRTQDSIKTFIMPGLFFEDLGFRYFGPINGHDLDELLQILGRIRDLPGPILLHVLTKKGKGHFEAEKYPTQFHGIGPRYKKDKTLDVPTTYTDIFGETLIQLAERSDNLCAITAAMVDGTGLNEFSQKFTERFFDVGIAEEHAVTFAAGMAVSGMRPVVAIYSTFLQRAFDQIIHDVALQKLPVIFTLDRSGLVGEDGPTHHGAFDLSYLNLIPNLIVAAPKDGKELQKLLYTALIQDRLPFVIRYPRDTINQASDINENLQELEIGSWEILKKSKKILILAVGSMVHPSLDAAEILKESGIYPTIVNCRFVKPIDVGLLTQLLLDHSIIFTIEENTLQGGVGSKIASFLAHRESLNQVLLKMKGLPDNFVEQGPRKILLDRVGLSAQKIAEWILLSLEKEPIVESKETVKHI
jgi:1-deoxy-D-xylulose-5-phosphate synthase